MSGPLAPSVLEEIEARLAQIRRPASVSTLAEALLQAALALRNSPRPPRDLALIAAARAAALADAMRQRDEVTRCTADPGAHLR